MRRIILNLSYPRGQSINDTVDNEKFDSRSFILTFPSIDVIVIDSKIITDPLVFNRCIKSMQNLRVDPVDALKFGLTWNDALYINRGVIFSWMHASTLFQMVAETTIDMSKAGCHVRSYIDEFLSLS